MLGRQICNQERHPAGTQCSDDTVRAMLSTHHRVDKLGCRPLLGVTVRVLFWLFSAAGGRPEPQRALASFSPRAPFASLGLLEALAQPVAQSRALMFLWSGAHDV